MSDIYGIAKSGLQAYREGLATTGQNIANVGNENYARREVNLTEVKSASADVLSISPSSSYGVKVDGVVRAFDQFIDMQLQNATSGFSFSTSQAVILDQLEQVVRPPKGTVSERLQELFAALNGVAQDPSDPAGRHIAVDASSALVTSIRNVAKGISDLRTLVEDNISNDVEEANSILKQLGEIQKEMMGIVSSTSVPNDLLDQRDSLLRKLSEDGATSEADLTSIQRGLRWRESTRRPQDGANSEDGLHLYPGNSTRCPMVLILESWTVARKLSRSTATPTVPWS